MALEKIIYDENDNEALVIHFDESGELLEIEVYSTAFKDFMPVKLSSRKPEVIRLIKWAENKINQHFETEQRIAKVQYLEAY